MKESVFMNKFLHTLKSVALLCLLSWALTLNVAKAVNPSELECVKLGLLEQSKMSLNSYTEQYIKYLEKFDIYLSKPYGFIMVGQELVSPFIFCINYHFKPSGINGYIGGVYTPPYRSLENDAVILFPLIIEDEDGDINTKAKMEIIAANSNDDIDITDKIKKFDDSAYDTNTKADKIYLYEFDLPEPFEGKYRYCVSISLSKNDYYPIQIKLLLNDEGKKKKEEYIRNILETIRFSKCVQ